MTNIPLRVVPQTVTVIALILRGFARYHTKIKFGLDDFFACFGTAAFWGYSAASLWHASHQSIYPPVESPYQLAVDDLKTVYANGPLTVLVITCAKLSTLFLYKRIFWPKPWFNVAINVILAASAALGIAIILASFLRCSPISAAWNPKPGPGAKCISLQTLTLAYEIPNCVTEVAMILLAIYAVHVLGLPTGVKFGISLIFALGFFVAALSVVRTVEVVAQGDGDHGAARRSTLWGPIQMCTALCIASLLTYQSLVPKSWNVWPALREWYSDIASRRSHGRGTTFENEDPSESNLAIKLDGYDTQGRGFSTAAVVADDRGGETVPPNTIAVKHTVSVT